MSNSKTKKHKGPKMILRLFDPRDDRIGGNEDDEDGYEKPSPFIVKKTTPTDEKKKNSSNLK